MLFLLEGWRTIVASERWGLCRGERRSGGVLRNRKGGDGRPLYPNPRITVADMRASLWTYTISGPVTDPPTHTRTQRYPHPERFPVLLSTVSPCCSNRCRTRHPQWPFKLTPPSTPLSIVPHRAPPRCWQFLFDFLLIFRAGARPAGYRSVPNHPDRRRASHVQSQHVISMLNLSASAFSHTSSSSPLSIIPS